MKMKKIILTISLLSGLIFLAGYTNCITQLDKEEKRFQKDREIFEETHKASFMYFWELGHPVSGLTPRKSLANKRYDIGVGASGFGIQAVIVGVHRGWVSREEVLDRLLKITKFLENTAVRFHGVFPHLLHGETGEIIVFGGQDGADIQETSNLMMGLLMARTYFDRDTPKEVQLRNEINKLWEAVDYRVHEYQDALWWNHSDSQEENNGLKLLMKGYTESMTSYVLALGHPTHGIQTSSYKGYVEGKNFVNGKEYYGYTLDVGKPTGGPLYLAQTPFLALDPRDMQDQYTYYWSRSIAHSLINYAYCVDYAPAEYKYSEGDWGLTASQVPSEDGGYNNMAGPKKDTGTIAPSAALGVFPYVPYQSMMALRNFYENHKEGLWAEYGFKDSYSMYRDWYSDRYLGLDQGRTVIMMENYRSGLFWELSKKVPELQVAKEKMGIHYPKFEVGFPLAFIENKSQSVQLYRHIDEQVYHLDFYVGKTEEVTFTFKSEDGKLTRKLKAKASYDKGLHQLTFKKKQILSGTKGEVIMSFDGQEVKLPVQLF